MLVHSLWDQEDIYGNIAVYKALKAQASRDHSNVFLVAGALVSSSGSGSMAAASAPFSSAATPRSTFGCICCGRFSIIF